MSSSRHVIARLRPSMVVVCLIMFLGMSSSTCDATTVFAPETCVPAAFAGAKKGGKKVKKSSRKRVTSSTERGFGVAPPTLEEVLAKFRTRLPSPEDEATTICPCGTTPGKLYRDCCAPFHKGQKQCLTPTDVLRTRYSAFSYRLVKYIIDTTHPTCRDYRPDMIAWAKDLNREGMFDSYEFVGLEVMGDGEEVNGDVGYIDFKVRLRARDQGRNEFDYASETLAGAETVISERSKFLRSAEDGSWSYASGEVRSDVVGDAVLNTSD